MIKYSVFPMYGNLGVVVIEAESLLSAIEQAFACKLESVAHLYSGVFTDYADTQLWYGLIGAIGVCDSRLMSLLCSATVIAWGADEVRRIADIESVSKYAKERGNIETKSFRDS